MKWDPKLKEAVKRSILKKAESSFPYGSTGKTLAVASNVAGQKVDFLNKKISNLSLLKERLRELGYPQLANNKDHLRVISILLKLPERELTKGLAKLFLGTTVGEGLGALSGLIPSLGSPIADLAKEILSQFAVGSLSSSVVEKGFRKIEKFPSKNKIRRVARAYTKFLKTR